MPGSPVDVFRRALFAFASVHTTWKSNCALYNALYELSWLKSQSVLLSRIQGSGAGLHNNRAAYIWEFAQKYWAHPEWYRKQVYEDWFQYRDRLDTNIKGLGLAKSAFFIELSYLHRNQVPCVDVHMLRLFGIPADTYRKSGAPSTFVRWCEQAWVSCCNNEHVSPTTARWYYWDTKQQQPDSRYWAGVLEGPPAVNRFTNQLSLGLRP